ncbi:MAG TPA: hypothetical protein VIC84_23080 [Blastocatellia bacterium]|jgi:hypothetical protein
MIANFGIGSEAEVPYRARLSSDYAAGRITAGEYNDALHMSELAEKRPFCKTTWSKVEASDIVLKAWESLDRIVEIEIEQCVTEPGLDGALLIIARFVFGGLHYGQSFDPDETVYVQQR